MSTLQKIIATAQGTSRRIVLPESTDPRILQAAAQIAREKIAKIILIGNAERIRELANSFSLPESGIEIVDPVNKELLDRYSSAMLQLQKHRKMTLEQAFQALSSPLVLGAMMVKLGEADGLVAGAVNTTSDVVRAALQWIGMKPGSKLVSSFFIMDHDLAHQAIKGAAIYADCALVINPDAEQLANITIDTVDSARSLIEMDPVVALLSFSTAGSASHPYVDKVRLAGGLVASKRPDIPLMSEVQFDAAILQDILHHKAPAIKVKAPANIFIFPDLQSANIGYKIAERIGGVKAIGPVLQGLNRPVNDLSRGCSVDDIVQLVAVTAVQSMQSITLT